MAGPALRVLRSFVKNNELAVGLALTIFFALFSQWLEFKGFLSAAEVIVSDRLLALGTWSQSRLESPAIVTLAIDDDAYEGFFKGQSPLAPQTVVSLVNEILSRFEPAVLGVDLLTEWDRYDELRALIDASSPVVWVASARARFVDSPRFFGWLLGTGDTYYLKPGPVLGGSADRLVSDGNHGWGVPLFPREMDRAIRRVPRTWVYEGTTSLSDRTFARQVAEKFCEPKQEGAEPCSRLGTVDEAFLTRVGREPVSLKVRDYFTCWVDSNDRGGCEPTDREPQAVHKNAIVLLGGTFAEARDAYPTPRSGSTAGLELNAYAVQVELSGRAVKEPSRSISFGLDLVLGMAVVVLFWFSHHERESKAHRWGLIAWLRRGHLLGRKVQVGLFLIFASIVASAILFFWGGRLWLGWVSVLVGGFAWQVVFDVVIDDPPDALRVRKLESRAKRRSRRSSR